MGDEPGGLFDDDDIRIINNSRGVIVGHHFHCVHGHASIGKLLTILS